MPLLWEGSVRVWPPKPDEESASARRTCRREWMNDVDAYREENFDDFEIADATSDVQRGIGRLPMGLGDSAVFEK